MDSINFHGLVLMRKRHVLASAAVALALLMLLPSCACCSHGHRRGTTPIAGPSPGLTPPRPSPLPTFGANPSTVGSGPTMRVVRIKNATGRSLLAGMEGWASRELGGEPTEPGPEIGPWQQVDDGNFPGAMGTGFSSDTGYEQSGLPAAGPLTPSMKFMLAALAPTPEFDMTVLPDFYVTIPGGHYFMQISEVVLTLVAIPWSETQTAYRVDYEVKFSVWHDATFSWDDNPAGSPAVGSTGVLALADKLPQPPPLPPSTNGPTGP